MSAMQILAAQPWVPRLGWTLLHFLWQGARHRHRLCRRTKVGRAHLRPERPLFARLCGAYGDGHRPPGDLDAPAGTGDGIRCRQLRGAVVRRTNRARSIHLPGAYKRRISCHAWAVSILGGRVLAYRRDRFLAAPAGRLDARRASSLQNGARRVRRMATDARSAQSSHFCLPAGPLARVGALQAPAAIGWLRPVVLVPAGALAGLPSAQIEALLLHELAHIRRHDYLVNILQSAVEAVFFYHPAVWWISSHIRAERELCCDDIAVSITGDAVVYARALAEFDSARLIQPAVMAANGGSLAGRIARLLGQSSASRRASRGPGAAPALILLAIGAWAVLAQTAASAAVRGRVDQAVFQR